ncbi:MAG: helix-turn-helix transcriptional regulator [Thermoguttaceae bacterium]
MENKGKEINRHESETTDKKKKRKKPSFTERVKRLFTIIQMCQHSRMTTNDLAAICKTHKRTIYRDINVLRSLGMVVSRSSTGSRLRISSPVNIPPMLFTLNEAFTLLTICSEAIRNPQFPFFEEADEAVQKLLSLFPTKILEDLRQLAGIIFLRREPVNPHKTSKPIFKAMCEALVYRRAVRIWYKSPVDSEEICTLLFPYQIMFAKHAWYIIGRASLFRQTRTFHVDRIRRIEITEDEYQIPHGFSLEKYLGNAWSIISESGPDKEVIVRFSPLVAQNVSEVSWHRTQKIVKRADGSIDFHVQVSGLNEILWWILGYGKEAEVIKPLELREKIRNHVCALSEMYISEEASSLNPNYHPPSLNTMKHPLDKNGKVN